MKFLLFNLAVAGALVFLFTSDRGDLRALADRAFDATQTAKKSAQEAVESVVDGSPKKPAVSQSTAPQAGNPVPSKPFQNGAAPSPAPSTPPQAKERPMATTIASGQSGQPGLPETKPVVETPMRAAPAADSAAAPETVQRRVVTGPPQAIASLPPEVAKRRAEVLGDMAPSAAGGERTIDVTVKKFMTPAERRRDLMLLSEEMELLSAGSIGQ